MKLIYIAKAISESCEFKFVGIRPGEKIHEEMISIADAINTIDLGKYYAILPSGYPLNLFLSTPKEKSPFLQNCAA